MAHLPTISAETITLEPLAKYKPVEIIRAGPFGKDMHTPLTAKLGILLFGIAFDLLSYFYFLII